MKCVALANGWNEAKNLQTTLSSTNRQDIEVFLKVYVDDGSTDGSPEIADALGWNVVRLPWIHENLAEAFWIGRVLNYGLLKIYSICEDFDYLLIAPCDAILPRNYVSTITERMKEQNITISSGNIRGETALAPRGAGRIFEGKFVREKLILFPPTVSWENWALFKALSFGYRIKIFYDILMEPLRRTRVWSVRGGRGMRELGYFPPYVLLRILRGSRHDMKNAIKCLADYLSINHFKDIETDIKDYASFHQAKSLSKLFKVWKIPKKIKRGR